MSTGSKDRQKGNSYRKLDSQRQKKTQEIKYLIKQKIEKHKSNLSKETVQLQLHVVPESNLSKETVQLQLHVVPESNLSKETVQLQLHVVPKG
jgi:hypothetical protein